MSRQAVHDFLSMLKTDQALADEAARLEASVQKIAEFACAHGFDFTPDEFEAAMPKPEPQPEASEDRDLTETELDLVAGAGWGGYWTWNATTRQWVWTWVWYNDASSGWSVS